MIATSLQKTLVIDFMGYAPELRRRANERLIKQFFAETNKYDATQEDFEHWARQKHKASEDMILLHELGIRDNIESLFRKMELRENE